MKPLLIVQEAKRENVEAMRKGLGPCDGVIVLGMEARVFWSLAGLDALFLTLPQAEAWGSKPLAPHVSEVLRTRETELKKGFPPYVVTGMTLKDDDSKTGRFTLPLVVTSAMRAVRNFNEGVGSPIQTVGLTEVQRFAQDVSLSEMGELIRSGYEATLK